MAEQLIIFGAGDIAQLAHYYFSADSGYRPAAFTVDEAYLKQDVFCGLPVVPFDGVDRRYPPSEYRFFVALSYSRVNAVRKEKFLAAKALGYRLATFVSPHATVLNDGRIGENCFILEDNTIQPLVTIGDNVTLWSGNHIGHHARIGDHCFISSHVVVSGGVHIGEQCFIGVNATLRDHITVAERCVIGAGTLIMADTRPDEVYIGRATKGATITSDKLKKI